MPTTREQAEDIIDRYVRPLVEADGGHVEVVGVSGDRVTITLTGTCLGCPGRPFTIERVIQRALRSQLGDAVSVVVQPHAAPD